MRPLACCRINKKGLLFLLIFCCLASGAFAHTINYKLERAPGGEVFWYYLGLGVAHIVPYGADHILFVVSLCLLNQKLRPMLLQATAFTAAHTITLALSMKGLVIAPPAIVEPVIALSILFVAVENLLTSELKPWRLGLVFAFGLVHGLGFASALNEIGLPRNRFATSIAAFNIGVELGQIAVIATVFLLLTLPFRKRTWYTGQVVYPVSVLIACVALYWTVQRVFFS
jgi:hypothetical protein